MKLAHRSFIGLQIVLAALLLPNWQMVAKSDAVARTFGVLVAHGRGGPRGPVRYERAVAQRGFETAKLGWLALLLLVALAGMHVAMLFGPSRPWQHALSSLAGFAVLAGVFASLFELHLFSRVVVLWPQYAFWGLYCVALAAYFGLLVASGVQAYRRRVGAT